MCKFLNNLFSQFNPNPTPSPSQSVPNWEDKYALLVGINRYHPDLDCDLQGCVNDVEHLRAILIDQFEFDPDNIRVLTDERATHNNIIDRLEWLVDNPNSELVFQYSGHGSQIRDRNGDELNDGMDEILIPYDHDWDFPLTDDALAAIFENIPESSFFTMICDSCHSGTMTRSVKNKSRFLNPPRDIQFRGESKELSVKKIGTRALELNHVLFSGCRDDQYSADALIGGIWQGAFTSSLIKHIGVDKIWANIYPLVLNTISNGGFEQIPQLNGREIKTRLIFGGKDVRY